MKRRIGWLVLDSVWLIGLALYIFAGRDKVPFHGDESMQIAMSRDYFILVHQHDLAPILYDPTPADPAAQHLRIVNGTITKMAMGLIEDLDGKTDKDLNAPWVWEWSMEQNIALGHMPDWWVLRDARTLSTLLTVFSAWLVFGIAWLTARQRPAAYAASLIYTTTPAVLLNGRRAMMEGAHLCFSVLVVWVAILLARELVRTPARRGVRIAWYAALGVAAGLAVASKHPAVMTVAAAFAAVAILPNPHPKPLPHKEGGALKPDFLPSPLVGEGLGMGGITRIPYLAGAGVLMLIVFLALNPAWWSDPLHMPGEVLRQRRELLRVQVKGDGGFANTGEKITELVRQAFYARPQYYEVPVWQEYVGGEIKTYEATGLTGRSGGMVWGAILIAACAAGGIVLARGWRDGAVWIVLIWAGVTAISLLILTPLPWQRYYLPLQPPVAVIAGIGVSSLAAWGWRRIKRA